MGIKAPRKSGILFRFMITCVALFAIVETRYSVLYGENVLCEVGKTIKIQ